MKPVLLLIPGLSGTRALMKWIIPYLELHFTLHLIELPESQVPGDQDYRVLCTLIEKQYLPAQGQEPCWVLGESFSGPIAITLAKQYSERIAGVVLAASFAACPNRMARTLQKLLPALLSWRFCRSQAALLFLAGRHTVWMPSHMRRDLCQTLEAMSVQTIQERLSVAMQCDVTPLLPLSQPVLYLRAKQDWLVHQHALSTLRQLQPTMEVVSINSPHLILQFNPEEAAQSIQNFVYS